MRKTLGIVVLFFLCLQLHATIYYISPAGDDDTGDGSIGNPWFSIEKAYYSLNPGDTCYIRGGTYYYDNTQYHNTVHDGTASAHIYYLNYPGETPIFDFSKLKASGTGVTIYGMQFYQSNYLEFQGIKFRHLWQRLDNVIAIGCGGTVNNYLKFTNCELYDVSGKGFRFHNTDSLFFYNCDAHDCRDTLRSDTFSGNGGTGLSLTSDNTTTGHYAYFYGCRAWNCSDQGFSSTNEGPVIFENCWSFRNGYAFPDAPYGLGQGWKFGFEDTQYASRRIVNCVAAYNKGGGFNTNGVCRAFDAEWYNNTSYKNAQGFIIYNTTSSDAEELTRVLKNNIAYANNSAITVTTGGLYTHSNNSWDIPLSFTNADFISVDSTGITAPRQADGSLPDNDCYKYFLRPSSTFIGYQQGTDVGLVYDAVDSAYRTPPSIGFKEYYPITPAVEPKLADVATYKPRWITTTTATTGGLIGDDGGADITARGVCWNTTGSPTTANSKTEDGTGDGAFTSTMTGLTYGTVYYVRAYGTNSAGTSYGSEMTFRTSIIKHDNKVIKHNGKIMVID
jgi:hypothetical protein